MTAQVSPQNGLASLKTSHSLSTVSAQGRSLGRAIHHLLFHHRDIAHRGQLWTGLWTPQHRTLLGPHLRLCTLNEGQRILLQLSTWAAQRVPELWTYFQEHAEALEPLPTLPNTHYGTHRARSPRHGPPPPVYAGPAESGIPFPHTQAPARRPPPTRTAPSHAGAGHAHPHLHTADAATDSNAHHQQPPITPLPADHPGERGSRMTKCHQPSCPSGRLCRILGLAEMHNGGGHC